jgi:UMF1 family MFS transporter
MVDEATYRRRIRAWTLYDWANSAFATTILAAVLPTYYSQVAGSTLPSASVATAYWSTGLSVSLLVSALISPILGTISDVMRGKKRFLAFFIAAGSVATGLLVLVESGDWLLASLLFVAGRIAFTSANVFYDALLPHVANEEDRDIVSTRGYAMGYLGGGILLAVNVAMIFLLEGTLGSRLSFLSVGLWWAAFSIPLFRHVPEPAAASIAIKGMVNTVSRSIKRLITTFREARQYRELFRFLLAFFIYNDGIGTIIGVAAIYGTELGFETVELVLAILLVQFVGIPFSLVFGRLPSQKEPRRPIYLTFVLFNLIAMPLVGIGTTSGGLITADQESSLPFILGLILGIQVVGGVLAVLFGRRLASGLAATLTTKRTILLALLTYMVIALWAFILDTVLEFWFLAWMVAIVQGGSQALSRSIYSSMSPASMSGEFFGLFGVMEKFSAVMGPALFALAVGIFGSSRPAILSIIVFFVLGGYLLSKVDVQEGRRVAIEEDLEARGLAH